MAIGFKKLGTVSTVHSASVNWRGDADIAALNGGGCIATWVSEHQDGSASGVFARLFDQNQNPIGLEFQVNTREENTQNQQSVTALEGGGFVVTWRSEYDDNFTGQGVYAQLYAADGTVLGAEFKVLDTEQQVQTVAMSDGGFIVFFEVEEWDGSGIVQSLNGQRYDTAGNLIGGQFAINSYTLDTQNQISVAALTSGGFVTTWVSDGQDGSGAGVFGQVFDEDANQLDGELSINATAIGAQIDPTVSALIGGGFVTVWTSGGGQDGDGTGIFLRLFDDAGLAIGAEIMVNTTVQLDQQSPDISSLQDGGFVVVWESANTILAQRFGALGSKVGSEFTVVDGGGLPISNPTVSGLSDGSFVISWQSAIDGVSDISTQHFAARMYGGTNADILLDTKACNWLNGGAGGDHLSGLDGKDKIYGAAGNDTLLGGGANDRLWGGYGRDTLKGGAGKDTLKGGGGADTLVGGAGADKLFGGAGADVFVFASIAQSNVANYDTVKDFEAGVDFIDLSEVASGFTFIDGAAFGGAVEIRAFMNNSSLIIEVDVTGDGSADMKILLQGAATLDAGDLIL